MIKKYRIFLYSLTALMMIFSKGITTNVPAGGLSSEKDGKSAEKFIQDLGDKGIKTLTGKELGEAERRRRFEALFVVAFDYDRIGKFVLGRFRRQISETDMKEYMDLFKNMVVRVYAARFGEYNQEKFHVSSNRVIDKEGKTIVVSSKIVRPNDSKIAIAWHMYKDTAGSFKIFDVVVEGVSMALTQRSEFSAILQQGGIKKLIEELKIKKNNPIAKKMIEVTNTAINKK
ncbi:MAG: hypothetical protein A2977_04010 [Alphaproteobacteria bacterium RIFCSPLOWO2_01_FULL_45_8]|nr:MAG: hypothetical protein A2065_02660 [Alphaproteobacteria bacterium GWB1_45_5]OFW76644.1 MAG: hypothetical protein A3K20_00490 [Alphaproteobacteria bacterium GWA1_45_9]OFW89729.1 MAG: hypothetical protein A2621_02380 [Alphaproteobacteria bacterium RIFCSPHIGHO2_01_FULL_41_14]OFW96386.1 MAG: hypothetical protein A2977_04010 [Alphaproteobacteria bacterium RIFCSPLOWO2_01_FULL_45_8]